MAATPHSLRTILCEALFRVSSLDTTNPPAGGLAFKPPGLVTMSAGRDKEAVKDDYNHAIILANSSIRRVKTPTKDGYDGHDCY